MNRCPSSACPVIVLHAVYREALAAIGSYKQLLQSYPAALDDRVIRASRKNCGSLARNLIAPIVSTGRCYRLSASSMYGYEIESPCFADCLPSATVAAAPHGRHRRAMTRWSPVDLTTDPRRRGRRRRSAICDCCTEDDVKPRSCRSRAPSVASRWDSRRAVLLRLGSWACVPVRWHNTIRGPDPPWAHAYLRRPEPGASAGVGVAPQAGCSPLRAPHHVPNRRATRASFVRTPEPA